MESLFAFILNEFLTLSTPIATILGIFWWIERRERMKTIDLLSASLGKLASTLELIRFHSPHCSCQRNEQEVKYETEE